MPLPLLSTLLPVSRRVVGDRQGGTLVGYSSFMLLVAIAAIAVLTQVHAGADKSATSTIDLSS